MKAWHVAIAVGILVSAWAVAQEGETEIRESEKLIAQLEQLEQQRAATQGAQAIALDQQIAQLHARLERVEQEELFTDIRDRERDRVWDLEIEITDLREQLATEERQIPQLHRSLAEGRLAYLRELLGLSRQVATLEGPADLPKAFELLDQMEAVEMKWQMVDTPKLEGAARLFDMTTAAAELGNPPDLLAIINQAKQRRLAVVTDAENLFEAWSKHRQMRNDYEEAMRAFWDRFEKTQAARRTMP